MDIVEKIDNSLNESDIFMDLFDMKQYRSLEKAADDQSKKLLNDIMKYFMKRFKLSGNEERAFNRLMNTMNSKLRDEGIVRNNIFKIANELGMKLPSSMF